jgi:hypothetical protein
VFPTSERLPLTELVRIYPHAASHAQLKRRASEAAPQDLVDYLRAAPQVSPVEGDAIG